MTHTDDNPQSPSPATGTASPSTSNGSPVIQDGSPNIREGSPKILFGQHIWIPAARGRAVVRAAWWAVSAALTGTFAALIYRNLNFQPAAITNRLVDYSIAVAGLPVLIIALLSVLKTLQWLLLAVWPKPVGIYADGESLTLRLGPFRTRRFDAARLEIRYLFELLEEEDGGDFEAYLPEEQQRARFVPRIRHPDSDEPLNRTVLRFASGDEPHIARTLRPALAHWRREPHPSD